jgi:hypothetical protein
MSLTAALVLSLLLPSATQVDTRAKPTLHLAPDGFPTGQTTPEGAAADLARAFIARDDALFRRTCIRPYGPEGYPRFLEGVVASMKQEAAGRRPSPGGPKLLQKVFAARRLGRGGPASYALRPSASLT